MAISPKVKLRGAFFVLFFIDYFYWSFLLNFFIENTKLPLKQRMQHGLNNY